MPKLYRNEEGEYYTRCHMNGTFSTFHFSDDIKPYLARNHINIGDELPHTWYRDTSRCQYTHGIPCKQSTLSSVVNSKCPACGKPVFYYENEYGSKVYFDHAGDGWPKHPCMITDHTHINLNLIKINNLKIIFQKNTAIIKTDIKSDNIMTHSFNISQKKSLCQFYILKENNIPKKLIIIDNNIVKEATVIKYGENITPSQPSNNSSTPKPVKNTTKSPHTKPHLSKEKISIKKTQTRGNLIKLYLNEVDIAFCIKIRNPGAIIYSQNLYIINRSTYPKLLIVSDRTGNEHIIDILRLYKGYYPHTHPTKKSSSTYA